MHLDLNYLNQFNDKKNKFIFYNSYNRNYVIILKNTFENNLKILFELFIFLKNKSKNIHKSKILSAVIRNTKITEEIDVTEILRKYEGPNSDFYSFIKLNIKVKDIIDLQGNQIISKKYKLYIIDNLAEEYVFEYDDIIKY